jgi:hypothetical protein
MGIGRGAGAAAADDQNSHDRQPSYRHHEQAMGRPTLAVRGDGAAVATALWVQRGATAPCPAMTTRKRTSKPHRQNQRWHKVRRAAPPWSTRRTELQAGRSAAGVPGSGSTGQSRGDRQQQRCRRPHRQNRRGNRRYAGRPGPGSLAAAMVDPDDLRVYSAASRSEV